MRRISVVIGLCMVVAIVLSATAQEGRPYEQIMKEVGPTFQSLKRNIDGKMGADAAKDGQKLEALFKEVEAYWSKTKTQDAISFAKAAQTAAAEAAAAAKANNMEGALTAHGSIGKNCKGCHDAHRERLPDGTYKIKP